MIDYNVNRTILMYAPCILYNFTTFVQEMQQRSGNHKLTFLSAHFSLCCVVASFASRSVVVRLNMCSKLVRNSFISIQPWRPGLAGTRAQSCERYGSGTLHPGQLLGGSLPLLSPAFKRSHFNRQVPLSTTTREILAAKGGTVGEKDVRE